MVQDLLKAAEIRGTIKQRGQFDAAVKQFSTKYDALPGDMSHATHYGLADTGHTNGDGLGDGDMLIESNPACATPNGFGGESAVFWRHLYQAGMIHAPTNEANYDIRAISNVALDNYMPGVKIGNNNRFFISSANGRNYYAVAGVTRVAEDCTIHVEDAITPLMASQLDRKGDDGHPRRGNIRAIADINYLSEFGDGAAAPTPADGACVNDAKDIYATTNEALAGEARCQLRFRASF